MDAFWGATVRDHDCTLFPRAATCPARWGWTQQQLPCLPRRLADVARCRGGQHRRLLCIWAAERSARGDPSADEAAGTAAGRPWSHGHRPVAERWVRQEYTYMGRHYPRRYSRREGEIRIGISDFSYAVTISEESPQTADPERSERLVIGVTPSGPKAASTSGPTERPGRSRIISQRCFANWRSEPSKTPGASSRSSEPRRNAAAVGTLQWQTPGGRPTSTST
jgi:hypothetical protein